MSHFDLLFGRNWLCGEWCVLELAKESLTL